MLQIEAACYIFKERFQATGLCIHQILHRLLNVLLLLPQTRVESCLLL